MPPPQARPCAPPWRQSQPACCAASVCSCQRRIQIFFPCMCWETDDEDNNVDDNGKRRENNDEYVDSKIYRDDDRN